MLFSVAIESTSLGSIDFMSDFFVSIVPIICIAYTDTRSMITSTMKGCLVITPEYFSMGLIILPTPLRMHFFLYCKFLKLPVCIPLFIVLFQENENRIYKKSGKQTICYTQGKCLAKLLDHRNAGKCKNTKAYDGCQPGAYN